MKQVERTRLTYDKIVNGAIRQFGTKSYADASLNNICSESNISKGLIYHNFKGKDDLYLHCVAICFDRMTEFLKQKNYDQSTSAKVIRDLLLSRQEFFEANPYLEKIFYFTVLQPPVHLREEIKEIRKDYNEFCRNLYEELLENLQLRDNITVEMAIDYFVLFQEMFNGYFQRKSIEGRSFADVVREHEMNLAQVLDIMLYGIAVK